MKIVERGEKMAFFKDIKNIVFVSVIFVLVVALAVTSVVLAKRGSAYNEAYMAASAKLESTEESLSSAQSENSSYASELEAEREAKKQLEEENAGLKTQIEQLKAKKAAEEAAKALALKQQQSAPKPTPQYTPNSRRCYLTFDDGPCDNTLAILDILKRYNVKATFFVVGTGIMEYLNNIKNEGHAIGLHSATHVYSQIYANDEAYFNDLNTVSAIVEQYCGIKSKLVRFPGGSSNTTSKGCPGLMTRLSQSVPAAGYSYFDWNVSSGDASGASAQKILNNVLEQCRDKRSACVLMHDINPRTTQALPAIIEGLQSMGYYFEPLTYESYPYRHGILN